MKSGWSDAQSPASFWYATHSDAGVALPEAAPLFEPVDLGAQIGAQRLVLDLV